MAAGQQGAGPGRKFMIHDGPDHDIEFEDIFPEASATLASPPTIGGKIQGMPARASDWNGHHNGNGFAPDLSDTDAMLDAAYDEYARKVLTEAADFDATLDAAVSNGNGHQQGEGSHPHESPPLIGADSPEEEPPAARDQLTEAATFVAPSPQNASKTMNGCRFLLDHGHRLVLAWGDDEDPPDVYVLSDSGRLEVGPLLSMLTETARRYLASCLGLEKTDFWTATKDANALDSAEGWASVRKTLRAAYDRLAAEGLIPDGLTVIGRDDIDANLRYLGAPNGVVDLHTTNLLSPTEVVERRAFVHCSIPDDYDPDATHPAVDIIMPEEPATPEMAWWYQARGVALTRSPNREIFVHINRPGSGKTTIGNGDRSSFGTDYVKTTPSGTFAKPRFSVGPSGHNSGMFALKSPTRLVYIVEADSDLHPEPLNAVSGGESSTPARDVGEKSTTFRVTGHLVIQANAPENGDDTGVRLNLGRKGGADARAALAERLKFVVMPPLAHEARDPGFLDGNLRDGFEDSENPEDARRRRQALVARSVRQAAAMAGKKLPPPLAAMEDLAEERRLAEAPAWEREWLPHALAPLSACAKSVTFTEVYKHYLQWHADAEMDEAPATKNAIGRAIGRRYTKSIKVTRGGVSDTVYPGWVLNPAPAPPEREI